MKKFMMRKGLLSLMAVALLSGCGTNQADPSPIPPLAPQQKYTEPEQIYANPGSLFSEQGSGFLFEDNRARRVGDIVLIKIVENTKAKNKADTTTGKDSSLELGVSAFLGKESVLGQKIGATPLVKGSSVSKFSATGETKRENYVTTTIGARVIQVMPNDVLEVAGMREVKVNEETEYMVITGLVRGSDIMADNSVLSTQLADSKVAYTGKGVLADKQSPGWLTRVLDLIWPF